MPDAVAPTSTSDLRHLSGQHRAREQLGPRRRRAAPPIVGGYLLDRDRAPLYRLAGSRLALGAPDRHRQHPPVHPGRTVRRHVRGWPTRLLDDDDHDLIHKAVGWMLREAGKRVGRDELIAFLDEHAASHAADHAALRDRAPRSRPASALSGSTAPGTMSDMSHFDLVHHRQRLGQFDRRRALRSAAHRPDRAGHLRRHLHQRGLRPDQDVRPSRRSGALAQRLRPARGRPRAADGALGRDPRPDLRSDRQDHRGRGAPSGAERQSSPCSASRPASSDRAGCRLAGSRRSRGDRFVLGAGSRVVLPDIPGLDTVEYHTSDTVMRLSRVAAHHDHLWVAATWPPSSPTSSPRSAPG